MGSSKPIGELPKWYFGGYLEESSKCEEIHQMMILAPFHLPRYVTDDDHGVDEGLLGNYVT
jgi:hypothetical protein